MHYNQSSKTIIALTTCFGISHCNIRYALVPVTLSLVFIAVQLLVVRTKVEPALPDQVPVSCCGRMRHVQMVNQQFEDRKRKRAHATNDKVSSDHNKHTEPA